MEPGNLRTLEHYQDASFSILLAMIGQAAATGRAACQNLATRG
jgi:hypothetical protein